MRTFSPIWRTARGAPWGPMTAAHMLERDGLDQLFAALRGRGFRLVGPVLLDLRVRTR
jgi:hypothetical protein